MNPDYYKTYETDTYKHELERVMKMDDYQLETRYGKMTKQDKIGAFYEALTDADRFPKLRKKMEGNHGIPTQTKRGGLMMQFVEVTKDESPTNLSDDDVVRRQAIFTYEGQYYLYSYVRDASMNLDETMTFRCDVDGSFDDGRELFSAHGYIHSTDAMNNTVAHLESMETEAE